MTDLQRRALARLPMTEAEADIAGEAKVHNKWYAINKAEVLGACFLTAKVLGKEVSDGK